MSWSQPLAHQIFIKHGPVLTTLADARTYILSLNDSRERTEYWRHAAKLLLEANDGGDPEAVTRQLMIALLLDGVLDPKTSGTYGP